MNTTRITGKKGDQEITVLVKRPDTAKRARALIYRNKIFAECLRNGSMLRKAMREQLIKQGAWSDEKDKRIEELIKLLSDAEAQLKRGGVKKDGSRFTKEDARKLAIDMIDWRSEFISLRMELNEYDLYTADAQAENAEFNYLCAESILTEEGKPVFSNVDEYLADKDEDYAEKAAEALSKIVYNLDDNWQKKRSEIEFLIKYKFMNDNLEFIDENGNKVRRDGKRVDDKGRLINEHGQPVNEFGDVLNEDGSVAGFVEFE